MSWDKTKPTYPGDGTAAAFDGMKANFKEIEAMFLILSLYMMVGYYSDPTYDGTYTDRINSESIKNASNAEVCAVTYTYAATPNEMQCTKAVYAFNTTFATPAVTYTYDYTYVAGKWTRTKLTSIT